MGYPCIPDELKTQIRGHKALFPYISYRELAAKFNICEVTAWNICNEERKQTHVISNTKPQPNLSRRPRFAPPRVTDPTLLRKLTAGRAS